MPSLDDKRRGLIKSVHAPSVAYTPGANLGIGRPSRCAKCPYKSRTCATRGPVDSPIVIVGESPGVNEIIKNAPFVGESGKVLAGALKAGIEPFYTNAFHCSPIAKDANNMQIAARACHDRLIAEIKQHPRQVILALGNPAVWSLTGNYDAKITQVRGHIFPSELATHGIVAAYHPAFLLRGGGSSRLFKRDVDLAMGLAEGYSPYQYVETSTVLMETEGDIRDLIDMASASDLKYIAADTETTGFSARYDYILSHGFCFEPSTAYIVPPELAHLVGDMYNPSIVSARYIWHNGKYDTGMLRGAYAKEHSNWATPKLMPYELAPGYAPQHNVAVRGNRWGYQFAQTHEDTMLLSYSLDENGGIHGLEVLANDLLGAPHWKSAVDEWRPKKDSTYAYVPKNVLYRYQGKDLGCTLQIFNVLRPQVAAKPRLEELYTNHLLPSSETLTWVESNGVEIDPEVLSANDNSVSADIISHLKIFQDRTQEVIGIRVNPNSWQQVQKFLYRGGLDIADGKVLATDAKTLMEFPECKEVKLLQNCRETQKLHAVYIRGMAEAIEPSGRIHSTYLLHGTTTGRLASRNPSLQNIVRDDRIKNQFRATAAHWLLSNDLSQAELRVLACLSKDPALCEIFASGVSIHPIVATKFYGPDYSEDQYQLAKAVTFGIVYGRSAASIAMEYQITVKEAQAYIDNWFRQFPDAKKFINECRMAPLQGKVLKTPWGRMRRFGIVGQERAHLAGNEAANFPEQSMASDITLEATNIIRPQLIKWGVKVINLVHDDIIKEIAQDIDLVCSTVELVHRTLKEVPIRRGLSRVPFEAEYKIGTHWGSLHKNKKKLPLDEFLKTLYNKESAGELHAA